MDCKIPYIPTEWDNIQRPQKTHRKGVVRRGNGDGAGGSATPTHGASSAGTVLASAEMEAYVCTVIQNDINEMEKDNKEEIQHKQDLVQADCNKILDCIAKTITMTDPPTQLMLDNIISQLPFKDVLYKLNHTDINRKNPNLPLISKRFEESFMRAPMHARERLCAMGGNCECNFIDLHKPFTAVEFCPPMGTPANENTQRHMCVICHRKLVQSCFYDAQFSVQQWDVLVQNYGNIFGHTDEYSKGVVLISPPNTDLLRIMPLPIACHQRNQYTVDDCGVRHLIQNNMTHIPEQDFLPPSL